MFDYILFDLDGTLTDPKIGITSSVQYALRAFGIDEPNLDKLEPFIGPPLTDSFMEFYDFTKEQAQQAVVKYRERFDKQGIYENTMYEGIDKMLSALKERGKILSIASSKPTPLVTRVLEHFQIKQYFDYIVGSEFDGTRSKKEEVVAYALEQMAPNLLDARERKARVAMVGDRKFDVEGAKAFGLTSVGVSFGYASEGELEAAGADYIVDTVSELEELLM
ncbi:MAG: HAD family hydrolase [Lachnospiraceae bacterium]|nr:HAD family hydrolase [Lachnospiraceae bacterium]